VAASRNVLIVDDNDRHLDILSAILTSVGHNVETCGSGAEALRRLEGRNFDIVVLDLVMPEISGVVVAAQMRQSEVNSQTPIIICTANMAIAHRQLQHVDGIAAIIGKADRYGQPGSRRGARADPSATGWGKRARHIDKITTGRSRVASAACPKVGGTFKWPIANLPPLWINWLL